MSSFVFKSTGIAISVVVVGFFIRFLFVEQGIYILFPSLHPVKPPTPIEIANDLAIEANTLTTTANDWSSWEKVRLKWENAAREMQNVTGKHEQIAKQRVKDYKIAAKNAQDWRDTFDRPVLTYYTARGLCRAKFQAEARQAAQRKGVDNITSVFFEGEISPAFDEETQTWSYQSHLSVNGEMGEQFSIRFRCQTDKFGDQVSVSDIGLW